MNIATSRAIELKLLDTEFEITTDSDLVRELLEILWTPFLGPNGLTPYRLEMRDGTIHEASSPGLVPKQNSAWGLLSELGGLMVDRAVQEASGVMIIHAAAVARADVTLVMPGLTGMGKSTLTLELLQRGWSYMSDDIVPVDVSTGCALPFPKPISIKDPSRWEALSKRWHGLHAALPFPASEFLLPARAFDVVTDPRRPLYVAAPCFRISGKRSMDRLTTAEAVAAVGPSVYRLEKHLTLLASICRELEAVQLSYDSTEEAMEYLSHLMEGV